MVKRVALGNNKMTSVAKSKLPDFTESDDLDDFDVEYSFAMEYSGPPIGYDIPQVVPVDVGRIPTAAAVAKASGLNTMSVPVIQPIVKRSESKKNVSKVLKSGSEVANSLAARGDLSEFGDFGGASSCQLNGVTNEGAFGLEVNGDGCRYRVSDENGSSGTLGFSESREDSNEMSGSSDVEDFNVGFEEENLEKTSVTSPVVLSEVSSCEGVVEDCSDEAACQGNRSPVVTFLDHPSREITSEESDHDDETENDSERPIARSDLKKRLCHRCLKGNRFTEKEVCLVCGAKYCRNCVLRAMGSMPEGRKCITCIGFGINESKRGSLGKCSRMLKRLLSEWEIERIMCSEISSKVNQLPPRLIRVNGKPLSIDELDHLQSCAHPPKKLKPGNYWYDKVSGFWGKEGEKPYQIISPDLAVGHQLKRDASNGNTNVIVNGREITKPELRLLKFARIRCEGKPSYWLSADGTFQEEGQRNVMGILWDKAGIKLYCVALSLPVPPDSENPRTEVVDGDDDKIKSNNPDQDVLFKLLLVGCDQSGTSTLFKQAKIIYNVPFLEDERQTIKFMIQKNLYAYVAILLEGRQKFEEDYLIEMRQLIKEPGPSEIPEQLGARNIYSINPRLKTFSDWLLQVNMLGNLEAIFPASTREYAPLVEELWKDKAFQAAYSRRNELSTLPRVANYFLDRAIEISRVDYEPSNMDILYAEGISSSNGVASVEFSSPKSSQEDYMGSGDQDVDVPLRRYQLIRVHAKSLGEHGKWLEMFEDVDLVIYCVSLTDYDEFYEDSNGFSTNKMLASRKFFESIINHPKYKQKSFLLVLTKLDLLEEMIEQAPLTQCEWFEDYNPVLSHHPHSINGNNNSSMAQRAFHYIAVKFKRLFSSLTGRKLYVSSAIGLESDSVNKVLKYGMEILKWEEERTTLSVTEWSSTSMFEPSTT